MDRVNKDKTSNKKQASPGSHSRVDRLCSNESAMPGTRPRHNSVSGSLPCHTYNSVPDSRFLNSPSVKPRHPNSPSTGPRHNSVSYSPSTGPRHNSIQTPTSNKHTLTTGRLSIRDDPKHDARLLPPIANNGRVSPQVSSRKPRASEGQLSEATQVYKPLLGAKDEPHKQPALLHERKDVASYRQPAQPTFLLPERMDVPVSSRRQHEQRGAPVKQSILQPGSMDTPASSHRHTSGPKDFNDRASSPKLRRTSSLSSAEDLEQSNKHKYSPPSAASSGGTHIQPGLWSTPLSPNTQVSPALVPMPASSALVDPKQSTKENPARVPTIRTKYSMDCGLRNLGNTCYMNAIIQVMKHIYELNDPVLRYCTQVGLKPDSILKSYGDLIRDMQVPGTQSPSSLRSFKAAFDRKCPRFSGYDQQDATEFMRLLINEMHEEWKATNAKLSPPQALDLRDQRDAEAAWLQLFNAEKTEIAACFMGMFRSTIKCLTCSNEAVKFDPMWDLSVPCPQHVEFSPVVRLEACLDLFTKEETLDKDERPYCSKCCTKTTSVKQLTLQKMPHVMVIVLKRFAHSKHGTIRKVETTISVPFTLDMNKYLSNAVSTKTLYSLFAIANHVGTDRFGHYTAWCKNDLEWNLFNDLTVTKSPPPEGCKTTKDAYALFYRSGDLDVV